MRGVTVLKTIAAAALATTVLTVAAGGMAYAADNNSSGIQSPVQQLDSPLCTNNDFGGVVAVGCAPINAAL
jgi:hypothetical protein